MGHLTAMGELQGYGEYWAGCSYQVKPSGHSIENIQLQQQRKVRKRLKELEDIIMELTNGRSGRLKGNRDTAPYPSFCIGLRGSSWAWCLSACQMMSWRTRWGRFGRRWHTEVRYLVGTTPAGQRGGADGWEPPPGTSCSHCFHCLYMGLWGHGHSWVCAAVQRKFVK